MIASLGADAELTPQETASVASYMHAAEVLARMAEESEEDGEGE